MISFLFSSLSLRFARAELDSFQRAHPYDWLLWEPGDWRPPANTTLVIPPPAPGRAQRRMGEALALALEPKPQLTFGRGPENDLSLNDGTLSNLHLVFMRAPDGWTVRDAGSRNGTRLDGVFLTPGVPSRLSPGAKLLAGRVELSYYTPTEMLRRLQSIA